MPAQNLFFNILTFDWPKKPLTFYFSLTDIDFCKKIHRTCFPKNIEKIFPGITANGTEFIYTTYDYEKEDFTPLKIDLSTENENLVKRYYNNQIKYYFKKVAKQIVRVGFIKENQVWLPAPELSTDVFDVYTKFSLKVQIGTVSKFPEILLSYDRKAKVLKKTVAEIIHDVSPKDINWVMFDGQLHKFDNLQNDEIDDYGAVYPVLNFDLHNALGFATELPPKQNRYPVYLKLITDFFTEFLNKDEFRKFIPLHNSGFLKANPATVFATNLDSNQLVFGNNGTDIVPHQGMKVNGPYAKTPYKKIHFFFIFHPDDRAVAEKVKTYLETGLVWFRGLNNYVKVLFHTEQGFSIQFSDKENPIPHIDSTLSKRNFNQDVKYFAIYITPYSRFEKDLQKREIYYKIKELLLKRDITSQVIDANTLTEQGDTYTYSLTNISIAILAKLKGIPWRLRTQEKNELIVGVGAFKHKATDVQYIGSAFSFNNNGSFNRFEYFMKHEVDILAGCISSQIREYATVNNAPARLIIHFYKTMSEEELEPIENALNDLGLDIPVFIISINKTESADIVAFDENWKDLMPISGTYVNIGQNKYLLFNNTRYSNTTFKPADGWPFPIKLKIDCTDKTQLTETKTIKELIDQVYQFSRMYWKSVRQQNLPVTIKYPEMVAQIAPHFDGDEIPSFGKDNLWFL